MSTTKSGGSEQIVERTGTGSRSETGSGRVHAPLGEGRGSGEAGGEAGRPDRDPERGTVEIGRVHRMRESEHGIFEMGVEGADGGWGGGEPTARARDEVGRLGKGGITYAKGHRSGFMVGVQAILG